MRENNIIPNALEIEEGVLCAVISDFDYLIKAANLIKPKHFFDEKHQIIYKAIYDMYEASEHLDTLTLHQYLKKLDLSDRVGGLKYISKLTSVVPASNIEFHCKVIIEKWMLREIIAASHRLTQAAYNQTEDVFELASKGVNEFESIMSVSESSKPELNFYDRLPKLIDQIIFDRENNIDAGIKATEFPSFNHATLGLKPGNLVVISGKYKSGKTRFSLSLLRDFAVFGKIPVGLVGFEMDVEEYDKNLLSMQTGIRYGYLRDPSAKNHDGTYILKDSHIQQLNERAGKSFKDTNIYITDSVFTDSEAIAKIKYWVKKHGVKIVLVDYLQLIESSKKSERRDLEIADMSKRLKNLARMEKIIVFIIVQENDKGTSADSKGPLRDADFWFSIDHPVDDGVKSIKVNGTEITVDESVFQVKFKASRHSANGGKFVCKFYENGEFKELSTEYYGEVI